MGIFEKISAGIRKTRDSIMGGLARLVNSFTKIDEDFFDELEETLIMCDIGVETSEDICAKLRKKVKEQGLTRPADIIPALKDIIADMLGEDKKLDLSTKPSVILVIGVNGAGKTTTIGKLAAKLKNDGKKVIVAAADTFRAAAIDQLEVWTERAGVDIVKHSEGSDPASVVFDAVAAAKARGADVVICDTAGRLHNKKNLMDELRKITRICYQQAEGCSIETLLVLDATTGQNAVNQARLFGETANITGIVLTKLDGTAKGGIIISIHRELGIPVKLVGVGEKIDDLQEFSAHDFAEALFEKETDFEGNYDRLTDTDEEAPEEIAEGSSDADILDDLPAEEPEEIPEDNSEELPEEEPDAEDDEGYTDESEEDVPEDEDAADETEEASDEPAETGKKDLRNGRFGFLFKEITFGRKKKKDTAEDTDNNESEE